MKYFRTVAHVQTASCSKEQGFLKLATFFISATRDIYTNLLKFSENSVKIKARSARNFAYVSNYFQTKTFAWKYDCAISSNLQML